MSFKEYITEVRVKGLDDAQKLVPKFTKEIKKEVKNFEKAIKDDDWYKVKEALNDIVDVITEYKPVTDEMVKNQDEYYG